MGGGRFALAFAAGMVATVNPCGFAMLPAYLGWFISGDSDGDGAGAPRPATTATVLRAVVVATVVASGFVAVFGTAGALLSWFSVSLYSVTPWVTVVIGLGLVAVGIALVAGWQPTVALPKLERGTSGRGLRSMFLFGVSYAVASVSCTLPVFVAQVSNTFGRSFASGVGVFLTFTLGMAVVLVVLSVAVALARQSLVAAVRRAVRYVNRVAGALLVVTGAYVAWYGGYEIRSADRAAGADAAVDRVTGWSSTIANLVQDIGALRLGLVGALLVGAALAVTYASSASKRDSSSSSSSP